MFAIVLACILGLVTASHGEEDEFVALMVQEKADCANGDEYNKGTNKSLQQCANSCGNDGKVFFSYGANFDPTRCWCAGKEGNEDSTRCGWDDSPGGYSVYVALPSEVVLDAVKVVDEVVEAGKYNLMSELMQDLALKKKESVENVMLWKECGEALIGYKDGLFRQGKWLFRVGISGAYTQDLYDYFAIVESCGMDTRAHKDFYE